MKYNVKFLIVEDELIIAHSLKEMLLDMCYQNVVIAGNQTKAYNFLNTNKIDLALIDINLGKGGEGFEVAKMAKSMGIPFIYITSYTDTAMLDRIISSNPSAYISKPIQQSSLYTSISIALKSIDEREDTIIRIKEGNRILTIDTKNLQYVHAENNYVKLVCEEKSHLLRLTMNYMKEVLKETVFVQIHRSYLVNIKHIEGFEANEITIGKRRLPISRSYKESIKEILR